MKRNTAAAIIAALAGVLLLIVGINGVSGVDHLFALLEEWFGTNEALRILAYVLGGIAALGGVAVLIGAYLIGTDRVRTGKLLITLGSGAGILTLLFFLARNLSSEQFSYVYAVLPAVLGVTLAIVSRFVAKPKPIL